MSKINYKELLSEHTLIGKDLPQIVYTEGNKAQFGTERTPSAKALVYQGTLEEVSHWEMMALLATKARKTGHVLPMDSCEWVKDKLSNAYAAAAERCPGKDEMEFDPKEKAEQFIKSVSLKHSKETVVAEL